MSSNQPGEGDIRLALIEADPWTAWCRPPRPALLRHGEIQPQLTMKYLKTNLEGKVRNLPHFKSEALLPVFEAVVNSIQAIEERGNLSGGEIEVRVVREAPGMLRDLDESGITGFIITDNGIGFN